MTARGQQQPSKTLWNIADQLRGAMTSMHNVFLKELKLPLLPTGESTDSE
jgi:hypothetical protein